MRPSRSPFVRFCVLAIPASMLGIFACGGQAVGGTALDGGGATTNGSTAELWAPNSSTNNEWTITAA